MAMMNQTLAVMYRYFVRDPGLASVDFSVRHQHDILSHMIIIFAILS